jgi:hypothetical protein
MRAVLMNHSNTNPISIQNFTEILAPGKSIAVTAPLISDGEAFIGYDSEKSGCVVIPAVDSKTILRR